MSVDCKHGEIRHHVYQKCCDDLQCLPGYYYNCTSCHSCPDGYYTDKLSRDIECIRHSSCKKGEDEISMGTKTQDRICHPSNVPVVGTSTQIMIDLDPTTSTTNSPITPEDHTNLIVIVLAVLIIVITAIIVIFCICRYFRKSKKKGGDKKDSGTGQMADVVPLNPSDDKYKKNLKENYTNIRRSMHSDDGLFKAALRQGGCFSNNDLQGSPLVVNKKILDLAYKNGIKLKSLVHALLLTGQGELAKMISQSTEMIDFGVFKSRGNYKERLNNNRVYILNNLAITDDFWSYLRQDDEFTEEDEQICSKFTDNQTTNYLIERILTGSIQKHMAFLSALEGTGNDELAMLLRCNDAEPSVQIAMEV